MLFLAAREGPSDCGIFLSRNELGGSVRRPPICVNIRHKGRVQGLRPEEAKEPRVSTPGNSRVEDEDDYD